MATQAQIDAAKQKMDGAKSAMSGLYDVATKCCYKDGTLALGELSDVTCQKCWNCNNHPGCCSKQTCQNNMANYNASVNTYDSAADEYDNLISEGTDGNGSNGNGNGGNGNGIGNIDKKQLTKWILFGVIALGVIIGGIFLIKYFFKK